MAARTIIIDNDYATLQYLEDEKIVHHQFHQFIYGQAFRDVLSTGLDVMRQYHATKWLSDDRETAAIPVEDSQWAIHEWQPQAIKAGWKFWAIVMPKKVVGQMNMRQFIKQNADQGVTVQVFTDADEALAWLVSQRIEQIMETE